MEDAAVIALDEIFRLDPSIRVVANLLPGSHAWRREIGAPWTREPKRNCDNA
jgi:hypothetical protein